jgi:hypothetical protein
MRAAIIHEVKRASAFASFLGGDAVGVSFAPRLQPVIRRRCERQAAGFLS